jgi:hypothetical protein
MDEERKVSERLGRIAALRRWKAPEGALLAELRGLLEDGEALLAAETPARMAPPARSSGRPIPRRKHRGDAEGVTEASI